MQRLFSMFPAGAPGLALLLLRLALAMALFTCADTATAAQPGVLRGLAMLAGIALLLGALTPLAALLALLLTVRDVLGAPCLLQWLLPVHALALVLIGPGAYSLDARWFGRRLLVYEHDRREP